MQSEADGAAKGTSGGLGCAAGQTLCVLTAAQVGGQAKANCHMTKVAHIVKTFF
jgi:hypothetical protein